MRGRATSTFTSHTRISHHVKPQKSGVHRTSCFALYKHLLLQIPHVPPELNRPLLLQVIRAEFRKDAKLRRHVDIRESLQSGYQTLSLLESLHLQQSDGNDIPNPYEGEGKQSTPTASPTVEASPEIHQTQRSQFIQKLNADLSSLSLTYAPPPPPPPPSPRLTPYPSGNTILSRPLPRSQLSGRRHIPKLVFAAGLPFLRVKKPQPPLLSKILRDKIETKQRRIRQMQEIDEAVVLARDEDLWEAEVDGLLSAEAQAQALGSRGGKVVRKGSASWEGSYVGTLLSVKAEISRKVDVEGQKQRWFAERFYDIVKQEEKLAGEEKEEKRREEVQDWLRRLKAKVEAKGGVWEDRSTNFGVDGGKEK